MRRLDHWRNRAIGLFDAKRNGRRSRLMLSTVAVGGASALSAMGGGSVQPANAASSKQAVGMVAGQSFADPPILKASAGGVLRMVAKVTQFNLSGQKVWGEGYNGSFVGPIIQLAPGQKVALTLKNQLPVLTNLHFHGLHVSPSGSADNPFIRIAAGASFTYHLAIPASHPLGTFWYHDHAMLGSSVAGSNSTATVGADVESQISAGMGGTILVGDVRKLLPVALRNVTTHTMVFKDAQINAAGRIVQNTTNGQIDSNDPTVRLVNGQLRPVLTIHPGQTQLWRLANEGANIFYRLHLDGSRFTVIAHDGVPVARVTSAATLLLAPGSRYDVLVTAGAHTGTAVLRTLDYVNGSGGDVYPNVPLLSLRTTGSATTRATMPSGAMPTAPASLANASIAKSRTLRLTDGRGTMYMNGKTFSETTSVFATPGVAGTVEEWTILNATDQTHPMHIHTNAFQVMSINGIAQPYTSRADVVPVPAAVNGTPGRVVLRMRLADFTGRIMFHCHISAHENEGLMSFLNVVAP